MLQIVQKVNKPKKAIVIGIAIGALAVAGIVVAYKKWTQLDDEQPDFDDEFEDEANEDFADESSTEEA